MVIIQREDYRKAAIRPAELPKAALARVVSLKAAIRHSVRTTLSSAACPKIPHAFQVWSGSGEICMLLFDDTTIANDTPEEQVVRPDL